MKTPSISVIVPVGPAETSLSPMQEQLPLLKDAQEVVFVFCPESEQLRQLLNPGQSNVRSVVTEKGRAVQMNRAAEVSEGDFLWFLHLDSQFSDQHWNQLCKNLSDYPDHIHYFDLCFECDGKGPMAVNTRGANLRSRWLRLPFGDQGFALSKVTFEQLQGYPEDVPYGEDHMFIWRAHQQGVRLMNIPIALISSARKYADKGWLKLTLIYQKIWISQAIPQLFRLLKKKLLTR